MKTITKKQLLKKKKKKTMYERYWGYMKIIKGSEITLYKTVFSMTHLRISQNTFCITGKQRLQHIFVRHARSSTTCRNTTKPAPFSIFCLPFMEYEMIIITILSLQAHPQSHNRWLDTSSPYKSRLSEPETTTGNEFHKQLQEVHFAQHKQTT